jgi:hypothetical protein
LPTPLLPIVSSLICRSKPPSLRPCAMAGGFRRRRRWQRRAKSGGS